MIWRAATAGMRWPRALALPSVGAVWGTAFLTGLLTSTFSTLMIVLGSGRIGRDVPLSWMEVGLVALRDGGTRESPGPRDRRRGISLVLSDRQTRFLAALGLTTTFASLRLCERHVPVRGSR